MNCTHTWLQWYTYVACADGHEHVLEVEISWVRGKRIESQKKLFGSLNDIRAIRDPSDTPSNFRIEASGSQKVEVRSYSLSLYFSRSPQLSFVKKVTSFRDDLPLPFQGFALVL